MDAGRRQMEVQAELELGARLEMPRVRLSPARRMHALDIVAFVGAGELTGVLVQGRGA